MVDCGESDKMIRISGNTYKYIGWMETNMYIEI